MRTSVLHMRLMDGEEMNVRHVLSKSGASRNMGTRRWGRHVLLVVWSLDLLDCLMRRWVVRNRLCRIPWPKARDLWRLNLSQLILRVVSEGAGNVGRDTWLRRWSRLWSDGQVAGHLWLLHMVRHCGR